MLDVPTQPQLAGRVGRDLSVRICRRAQVCSSIALTSAGLGVAVSQTGMQELKTLRNSRDANIDYEESYARQGVGISS